MPAGAQARRRAFKTNFFGNMDMHIVGQITGKNCTEFKNYVEIEFAGAPPPHTFLKPYINDPLWAYDPHRVPIPYHTSLTKLMRGIQSAERLRSAIFFSSVELNLRQHWIHFLLVHCMKFL